MRKIAVAVAFMSLAVACSDGDSGHNDASARLDVAKLSDVGVADVPASSDLPPRLDMPVSLDVPVADAPALDVAAPDTRPADLALGETGPSPIGDGGPADGSATEAGPSGEAGRVSEAGASEAGASEAGVTDGGTAVVVDPVPSITTPGKTTIPAACPACPTTTDTTFTVDAGAVTSLPLQGQIAGATGNGTFYVESAPDSSGNVQRISGPLALSSSGSYDVTIPLFCGTQLVKLVATNSAGSTVIVKQVTTTNCSQSDIRVTISWDNAGRDWELHLIKPAGRINDQTNETDCTWTTCIGTGPDWGVNGDSSDNPLKDVDNTGSYGPENIYLSKPETGRYTVMVEHWGSGSASSGQAIINVRGTAYVFNTSAFLSRWVWTVATIDWPSGTVTAVDTRFDCSASWSSGCLAAVP